MALASAAAAGDPFGEIPGVVQEIPVPGTLDSRGVEVKSRAVRSSAKPEEVQRAIAKSFRKAQLYMPPPDAQFQIQGAPQITGYDAAQRRSYTAIFKADGEGTLVILGTADLSTNVWREASSDLPKFPGATGAIEAKDEGSRTLSFQATATEQEVKGFYDEVLGSTGWRWVSEGARWERADRTLSLTLDKRPKGVVSVVLHERPKANR